MEPRRTVALFWISPRGSMPRLLTLHNRRARHMRYPADEHFLAQLKWPAAPFPESFHALVSVDVNDGAPERAVPTV